MIPTWLKDLGLTAVILFIVLLIVREGVKLVGYFKDRAQKPEAGNGEKRPPCLSSPVMQSITSNQALQVEGIRRMETILHQLSDNSLKQTLILEALARAQEQLSKSASFQSRLLARMCMRLKLEDIEDVEGT